MSQSNSHYSLSSLLPRWLHTTSPAIRALVTLLTLVFFFVQIFGNLPNSALKQATQPIREQFHSIALYQRGWGMFAATNSRTTVIRNELTYADGTIEYIQYVHLKAGYSLTAWNSVAQDLQFDDNRDKAGKYLEGFLRYTCRGYDIPEKRLIAVAFQQQVSHFPIRSKEAAAASNPWRTLKVAHCQTPPYAQ
jgi:hypothetical protein